jgi:glycogen(starch) synthase
VKVAVLSRAVFPFHGKGGLERHVRALVRHLVRRGLEVTLYTPPAPFAEDRLEGARLVPFSCRPIPWPRSPGFVILDRSTNYLLWSLAAARRVLSDRPDVVHAEGGAGFGYACRRKPGDPPLVLHPQGLEEFKAPWLKRTGYLPLRLATGYAARRAQSVVVPDVSLLPDVSRYLSIEPPKAVVISNAIDLEEIDRPVSSEVRAALSWRLEISDQAVVLLSVGRLEANKGHQVLIKALARIENSLPPRWVWVLVGAGPLEARLQAAVKEAELTARVRFMGSVSDEELSALYDRATLFVHPSLYEGSSLVTLEAMAHRKPVVASAVGGIGDKIEEGRSGFLVPPGDPVRLAAALEQALSQPERLEALGRAGRRRVESEFVWTEKARRLQELYHRVLAGG